MLLADLDPRSQNPAASLADGSNELWDQVRARIVAPGGLLFFLKAICLYPDFTRRAHLPMCLFVEDDSTLNKLLEFPRRSLKSTCGSVGYPIWLFARAAIRGEDLVDRLALRGGTKSNSMRFLRQIKAQVETNQLLQAFLPELIPEFGNEQVWNNEEITFPRRKVLDAPSIDTLGASSKATGRHYDMLIEDDYVNEENWDSPDAITKAIQAHQLGENLLVDPKRSRTLLIENCWTQFDLNNHVIKNEPDTAVFSVGAGTGVRWSRTRKLPPRVMDLVKAWDDGDPVWPERFGAEELARTRQRVGNYVYNAQYENNPFDPDVVDFRVEDIGQASMTRTKGGEPAVRLAVHGTKPAKVWPLSSLHIVGAWDPATDSKTTRDRNGVVVVGITPEEDAVVLASHGFKRDPLEVITDVLGIMEKWGVVRMGIETVAFQRFIMNVLQKMVLPEWNRTHRPVAIGQFVELKPLTGKSKEARIRYLLSVPMEQKRLYVVGDQPLLLDETAHFPMGETDDILDALAYTALLWAPGRGEEGQEADARAQRALDASRDPITGY